MFQINKVVTDPSYQEATKELNSGLPTRGREPGTTESSD